MTISLNKQRYLDILSSGIFAKFGPEQLYKLYQEVGSFVRDEADKLDSTELFNIFELQFYLSLLTNHDVEAKSYLDRFNDQFSGKKSQKIMIMRSMYLEATGNVKAAMEALGTDPDELRASRRLATFARARHDGSSNFTAYIEALNHYLNLQPSDIIVWAELGDTYNSVGHYEKALFCYKEVLVHEPEAHDFFFKAGLSLYYRHLYLLGLNQEKKDALMDNLAVLEHSRDFFLKCVEINETHTKSWLGVYLLSKSPIWEKVKKNNTVSSMKKIEKLLAEMTELAQISQQQIERYEYLTGESGFEEFLKEHGST